MKKSNIAKRVVAVALTSAFVMSVSAVSVFAEWQFSGYDTTNPNEMGKVYNEVIGGKYTNNVRVDLLPEESIEWKAEAYERDYPHAGYDRLYLEGNAQSITRYNNLFPQWETRFHDFMWEVCGDHRIYQRQQTSIPGIGWVWDFGNDKLNVPDNSVFVPTTRFASTTDDFKSFGVGIYDMNGYWVSEDVQSMYKYFGLSVDVLADTFNKDIFTPEKLSAKWDNGHFVVTDDEIANEVNYIASKFVSGPSYYGENGTKDVAGMYLDKAKSGWFWDDDTVKVTTADIKWTNPTYEAQEPYRYFQYLSVNGLVFDGRADTPKIYRYTGGNASPRVEWRYQWSEAAYPYNVIEYKYLDGKLAIVDGEAVYRVPSGEFGKVYTVITDTEIQVWVKDDKGGNTKIFTESRVNANFGGGVGAYVPGAGYIFN